MVPPEVDLVTKIAAGTKVDLPVEGALSGFSGSTEWLNSAPLTPQALSGKVVLVNFWTFNCINCLHALPYVRAWAEKYRDHGLVVIGVHTPELPFERDIGNVRKAVARLKIDYPVAIDNGYAIWKAFGNEYWPAAYFVDAEGRIRHHHFGEHDYENSERVIQQLLQEAGYRNVPGGFVTASSAAPLTVFAVWKEGASPTNNAIHGEQLPMYEINNIKKLVRIEAAAPDAMRGFEAFDAAALKEGAIN